MSKSKKKIKIETVEGIFTSTDRGFGFVTIEGIEEDIFVKAKDVADAMHNDKVLVELVPATGKGKNGQLHREGKIIKILEHNLKEVVGTFQRSKNFGFVVPDNSRITDDFFVAKENINGALDGQKVRLEITEYPRKNKSPEGKVVEILGFKDDPGVDILSIVESFGIIHEFPEKVVNQAQRIPQEISEADTFGREDLRDVKMVTIDGDDTKDYDDAVSVRRIGDHYELGVHIADVANYVQESSALDKQALKRGTSIYLCDRVIPMLPRELSNGICSLNEGVDRLTLSCIMEVDKYGKVINHRIVESVICVNRRMTYNIVADILDNENSPYREEYADFVEDFELMKELALILKDIRHKRGSIDFDIPESKISLYENGRPKEIKAYDRNIATKIIEEFMLLANETVATHYFWMEAPFLYRTHDVPSPDKIEKLNILINNFGFHLKGQKEDIHPKEIQSLLEKIEGTEAENFISRITLRSMMQAKYSVEATGHFGLASKYYSHFTSPIRRYPDLYIHRIIKDDIRGRLDERKIGHYAAISEEIAKKTSEAERRAVEVERETNKLKKCQYMSERVGKEYEGIISGITSFGIFVELPNTCEGMVRISAMTDDFYHFNEKTYELIGERSKKIFKLGQTVKICVNQTDEDMRTIDFLMFS